MTMTFQQPSRTVLAMFSLIAIIAIVGIFFLTSTGKTWATARVGEAEKYTFRVADTGFERARGLSHVSLAELGADGMMFVFPAAEVRTFTMRGMDYDLDFIWVHDNKIVQIDRNIPAPVNGAEPTTLTSDPLLVDMVIEVPAGGAEAMNFQVGHTLTVTFEK